MTDILYEAKEQISRVNARIAQVAADYTRSRIRRDQKLRAGDFRRASELTRRLRLLGAQLAYLAGQKRLSDCAERHDACQAH
jgi:hypothetical protein